MLASLSAAVSGLDSFQQDMNVIGNNIANVNTDGFKAGRTDFADSFSNTLLAATGSAGSGNAMQVGTGVSIDSISNNWIGGSLNATGNPNDLAINGNGFFVVKDPTAGAQYATQAGNFSLDNNGYLVTAQGYRVQGYGATGGAVDTSTVTDIKIGSTSATQYTVDSLGVVSMNVNGTSTIVGQVLLQNFQDPSALVNVGSNLYSNFANAGALPALTAPSQSGLGTIDQGQLELSNVDLSNEMANLITAQRGFEANSKIISASNEMLQTVVNMVH